MQQSRTVGAFDLAFSPRLHVARVSFTAWRICAPRAVTTFIAQAEGKSSAREVEGPRILEFMRKITVAEEPEFSARVGDAAPTRITAILENGQRISREVNDIPGFASKPMQRPDIDRKFHSNISTRWPREKGCGSAIALGA